MGHTYSWPCMRAIADVVPNVRSFGGRGRMNWQHESEGVNEDEEDESGNGHVNNWAKKLNAQGDPMRRPAGGGLSLDYGERGRPWDT